MRSQHWLRWYLGAVRQQVIAWANLCIDLCHHMTLLGNSELMAALRKTQTHFISRETVVFLRQASSNLKMIYPLWRFTLTHWGLVTDFASVDLAIIELSNNLFLFGCAITATNAAFLSIPVLLWGSTTKTPKRPYHISSWNHFNSIAIYSLITLIKQVQNTSIVSQERKSGTPQ